MPAAVVSLVPTAISAAGLAVAEHAEPTGTQEPEVTNTGGEGWHMTLRA